MNRLTRIAVLVSGGGTNLQAIIDASKSGIIKSGEVSLVVSNNASAYALERAAAAGIPAAVVTRKKGATDGLKIPAYEVANKEEQEAKFVELLDNAEIDIIVLAGFMVVLSENFIKHYENRIINVHPSLIPSFCGDGFYGLRVHEAALEKGVKITGATVHYVNEITDGGKILAQKAVEVKEGDTPEILQRRVMEEAEWVILPETIERISYEHLCKQKV